MTHVTNGVDMALVARYASIITLRGRLKKTRDEPIVFLVTEAIDWELSRWGSIFSVETQVRCANKRDQGSYHTHQCDVIE